MTARCDTERRTIGSQQLTAHPPFGPLDLASQALKGDAFPGEQVSQSRERSDGQEARHHRRLDQVIIGGPDLQLHRRFRQGRRRSSDDLKFSTLDHVEKIYRPQKSAQIVRLEVECIARSVRRRPVKQGDLLVHHLIVSLVIDAVIAPEMPRDLATQNYLLPEVAIPPYMQLGCAQKTILAKTKLRKVWGRQPQSGSGFLGGFNECFLFRGFLTLKQRLEIESTAADVNLQPPILEPLYRELLKLVAVEERTCELHAAGIALMIELEVTFREVKRACLQFERLHEDGALVLQPNAATEASWGSGRLGPVDLLQLQFRPQKIQRQLQGGGISPSADQTDVARDGTVQVGTEVDPQAGAPFLIQMRKKGAYLGGRRFTGEGFRPLHLLQAYAAQEHVPLHLHGFLGDMKGKRASRQILLQHCRPQEQILHGRLDPHVDIVEGHPLFERHPKLCIGARRAPGSCSPETELFQKIETRMLQYFENQWQRRRGIKIDFEILIVFLQPEDGDVAARQLQLFQSSLLHHEVEALGIEGRCPLQTGGRWQRSQVVHLEILEGEGAVQLVDQRLCPSGFRYREMRLDPALGRPTGRNVLHDPRATSILDRDGPVGVKVRNQHLAHLRFHRELDLILSLCNFRHCHEAGAGIDFVAQAHREFEDLQVLRRAVESTFDS